MPPTPPLLEVRGLRKRFPGRARRSTASASSPGAGEGAGRRRRRTGAGKSTLMKILAGVYQPDEGRNPPRRPARSASKASRDALARGIVLIHQELNLAGPLSVTANLFLGRERLRGGVARLARPPGDGPAKPRDSWARVGPRRAAHPSGSPICRSASSSSSRWPAPLGPGRPASSSWTSRPPACSQSENRPAL